MELNREEAKEEQEKILKRKAAAKRRRARASKHDRRTGQSSTSSSAGRISLEKEEKLFKLGLVDVCPRCGSSGEDGVFIWQQDQCATVC